MRISDWSSDVCSSDLAYHNMVEYLWTYGNQKEFIAACKNLQRPHESRLSTVTAELKKEGLSLSGWIGTVNRPSQLKDEEGDNLNSKIGRASCRERVCQYE